MYHININVGNFALGKLKQRIEFSSKGFSYSQAVVQGVRHTQLIIRDNNIVK